MLYGFAFFSHQVGGFLGVFLGGYPLRADGFLHDHLVAFDRFGIISALINLPIRERPLWCA